MRYKEEKERGRGRARSAGFVFWDFESTDDFLLDCCGDKLIDYGRERELWATGYECAFLPVVKAAAAGTRALVCILYDWPGGYLFYFLLFTPPVLTYTFKAIWEVH